MRKLISLAILSLLLTASFSFAVEKPSFKNVADELAYLMATHRQHIGTLYQKIGFDPFDKSFFKEINFIKHSIAKNFLANVNNSIANGNTSKLFISYSKISLINGNYKAVKYNYKNHGNKIILTKETNNNGKILKALYNYNTKSKLLNVSEYKNNTLLRKKRHAIRI